MLYNDNYGAVYRNAYMCTSGAAVNGVLSGKVLVSPDNEDDRRTLEKHLRSKIINETTRKIRTMKPITKRSLFMLLDII